MPPPLDFDEQNNVSTDTLSECANVRKYPIPSFKHTPHVAGPDAYRTLFHDSLDYDRFWAKRARQDLHWFTPFSKTTTGVFEKGTVKWFEDGTLNAAYNCIDRHDPQTVALVWESDAPGVGRTITFGELREVTSQLANYLTSQGLKAGDTVTIYLPMIPEAVISMLACARMGVVHNTVFAGFSAESLRERIIDSGSRFVIAANVGFRGGKELPLGHIAQAAMDGLDVDVLWFRRGEPSFTVSNGSWWHEVVPLQGKAFDPIPMRGDAPLFMLYTSGSTGKPKGLVHSTAGYLLYAKTTAKLVFDLQPGDRFGCLADIGWITGHSYVVYGILANGTQSVLFEGTPFHPNYSRYWELADRLRLTQLYTAPTVLRALKKMGDQPVSGFKLDSLRVLGSVGEPINPEVLCRFTV